MFMKQIFSGEETPIFANRDCNVIDGNVLDEHKYKMKHLNKWILSILQNAQLYNRNISEVICDFMNILLTLHGFTFNFNR